MKKTVWLTLALAAVLFCGGYGVSAAERELVLQAEADTYMAMRPAFWSVRPAIVRPWFGST